MLTQSAFGPALPHHVLLARARRERFAALTGSDYGNVWALTPEPREWGQDAPHHVLQARARRERFAAMFVCGAL